MKRGIIVQHSSNAVYGLGFIGALIYFISTATGLYGILSDVKRINLMGCLVIPVILVYIWFNCSYSANYIIFALFIHEQKVVII